MTPASSLLTGSLPVGAHDAVPSGSPCAACACNCISDPNGDDPNNNAVAKSGGDHAAPSSRRRTLEEKPDIVEPVPATDRRKQIEVVGETRVVEGTISEPGFVDNLDGNRLDDGDAGSAPIPVAAVAAAAAAAAAAQGVAAPSASWPGVMMLPPSPPMPYDADVGRDVRQALVDWVTSPPQLQAPNPPRPASPQQEQTPPSPPRPVSPQQQEQQAPNPPRARPVSALAAALARMEAERQAAVRASSQAEMQREFNGLRAPVAAPAPAPAPVHEAASSPELAPSPQIRRSGRRRHHSRSRDVDAVANAVASAAQRMVATPPLPPPAAAAPSHDHCLRNFSCDLPQAFPHKLGCHRFQSPDVLHTALHYAYVAVYCVLYFLVSTIRWTLILIFLTDYPCLHIKLGLLLALLGGVLFYVLQFDTPDEPVIALGKTRAARSAVYEANGTLRDDGFEDFPEAAKRALRAYHQLVAAGDYDNDEYYDGDGEEYYDYGEYEVVPAVAYYKVAGLRERRIRKELRED